MQYFLYFILFIGLLIIVRLFTVLLHELGHAITVLIFTKQNVTIYIGFQCNSEKSFKCSIGKIIIFITHNPFQWIYGFCVPQATNISNNKQIVYIIAGPLASLMVGSLACYISVSYDLNGFIKLFFIIFLGSAFFDFLISIIPNEKSNKLQNGRISYNDGYNLKLNFIYKRIHKIYSEAVDLYNERKYMDAALSFIKVLEAGYKKDEIYRLIIVCFLQIKNYQNSIRYSELFELTGNMDSNDFSNMGIAYSMLGRHDRALVLYNISLQNDPDNIIALNNKGYTLNLIGQFEEAILLFDKAIVLNKEYAYSYNNRGLSKIKIGKIEEGLKDINRSFEIDPNNSYAYKNLGIYYLDKKNYNEALQLFEKANEIDHNTHMINELINETKSYIKQSI